MRDRFIKLTPVSFPLFKSIIIQFNILIWSLAKICLITVEITYLPSSYLILILIRIYPSPPTFVSRPGLAHPMCAFDDLRLQNSILAVKLFSICHAFNVFFNRQNVVHNFAILHSVRIAFWYPLPPLGTVLFFTIHMQHTDEWIELDDYHNKHTLVSFRLVQYLHNDSGLYKALSVYLGNHSML